MASSIKWYVAPMPGGVSPGLLRRCRARFRLRQAPARQDRPACTAGTTLPAAIPLVDFCASIGGAPWNLKQENRGIRVGGQDPEPLAGRWVIDGREPVIEW